MSLNKGIKYKKEKRREYTGGEAVSNHCRNHGGKTHKRRNNWECDYCKNNRMYQVNKERERIKELERGY